MPSLCALININFAKLHFIAYRVVSDNANLFHNQLRHFFLNTNVYHKAGQL